MRKMLAIVIVTMACGCAVPIPFTSKHGGEILLGYTAEHAVNRSIYRVVPGVDFSLGNQAGLRLGWNETLSLFPSDSSLKKEQMDSTTWSYAPPLGIRWKSKGSTKSFGWFVFLPEGDPDEKVGFCYLFNIGIHGTATRGGSSLGLGIDRSTVIYADRENNGAYQLHFDSWAPSEATMKKKEVK